MSQEDSLVVTPGELGATSYGGTLEFGEVRRRNLVCAISRSLSGIFLVGVWGVSHLSLFTARGNLLLPFPR